MQSSLENLVLEEATLFSLLWLLEEQGNLARKFLGGCQATDCRTSYGVYADESSLNRLH